MSTNRAGSTIYRVATFLLTFAAFPAVIFSATTSLIVDFADSEAQAATKIEGLPAALRERAVLSQNASGIWQVSIGKFQFTADAELVSRQLEQELGLKPVHQLESAPATEADNPLVFLPSAFSLNNGEKSSSFAQKNLAGNSEYEELEQYDTPGSQDTFRSKLINKRKDVADDDKLAGYIDLNLGIMSLLDGQYAEADRYLRNVADGDVAAAVNHRIMAMWRLGWLAHQHGDHLTAYRLFAETQEFADDNPRTRARMIKERAGIIMELAKDKDLGSLKETREFIDKNRSLVGSEFWEEKATIDLMYAETYYYEGDYQGFCTQVATLLQTLHPEAKKQRATALVFKGISEYKLGEIQLAFESLESVLAIDLGPDDKWQHIPDLKKHALNWLIELSKRIEDENLTSYYTQLLVAYEGGSQ